MKEEIEVWGTNVAVIHEATTMLPRAFALGVILTTTSQLGSIHWPHDVLPVCSHQKPVFIIRQPSVWPLATGLTVCAKLPIQPINPTLTSTYQITNQDEVYHLRHRYLSCISCWILYCQWYVSTKSKDERWRSRNTKATVKSFYTDASICLQSVWLVGWTPGMSNEFIVFQIMDRSTRGLIMQLYLNLKKKDEDISLHLKLFKTTNSSHCLYFFPT